MYDDDQTRGSIFPGFAILLAMAAMIAALVFVGQPVQATRVWVPAAPADPEQTQDKAGTACSSGCIVSRNPA
ncbi:MULTISPECIES: hypothetical protein [Rhizobium]|uniref:Uncharacterized protein n=1 Tax=Rhizobium bangladeshense TaxID=1138189 RepID=A0ABS7LJ62_9HYPH|nr:MULTISPECIES: hypothetical protein [Rhizobium]MBX4871648.1 hypothetical protein [Rhizobium bangladeshense]MBX4882962.1 hypothetical protein [Rhizobium bangladeshense]MBX4891350.1 hypothetical protein [Rhizobium bangladeshense]MBX4896869.1 hypothetical protein [Rhizobium bangladeshense]MBX4901089.1 hypothetical protein [Rhizobium bangladeshense]